MNQAKRDAVADLRRRYRRIAPFYDGLDGLFERVRYRRVRPWLFRGLGGRVLEAGVGTGRNVPFYPAHLEVLGMDLSSAMLQRAARRRSASSAAVDLAVMDLTRLACAGNSFDAAVASFVLCTLPDSLLVTALRELTRVVKPDGRIRLLEYVPATGRIKSWLARLWAPWVRWAYGARLDRRVDAQVREAGLIVVSRRALVRGQIELLELAVPTPSESSG